VYGAVDPDHQITRPLKVSHEEESVAKDDHLDVQEGIDIIRIGKICDLPRPSTEVLSGVIGLA
jgi:hypothetical protein